jgi:hypothetical protein
LTKYSSYLDLDTGRVESVSHELLQAIEERDEEQVSEPLEWDEQELEIAKRINSTDRLVMLPTRFDVHEWAIMRDFALSVQSVQIREELEFAIHGGGAFRHFKQIIRQHRIEEAWYTFRDQALRQIAIDWCEEHEIAWR